MSKGKLPKALRKNAVFIVRSSAAEHLTFVVSAGQGGVEAVFTDSELDEDSVIRKFRITEAAFGWATNLWLRICHVLG